jgi:phosphate transport system protein
MTPTLHTDREYEAELARLREQILFMGAKVEEAIAGSMRALTTRDSALARALVEGDHQINALEIAIDDLCLRILARRQPVASDLRFVTIGLKLVTDLERIGDLCVNICERVQELNLEPPLAPYVALPKMAEAAQGMVRDALDAFVRGDAAAARAVIERDQLVDAYYEQLFREALTAMMADPHGIYRVTRVQSIAKYLERIGDHATNVAEMAVLMVQRRDIRHLGKLGSIARRPAPRGVLFLCTANAARSQMAEGWARALFPPEVRVFSAGARPAAAVNPQAVATMAEVGIDLSAARPRNVAEIPMDEVDLIVTLCAEEVCPITMGPQRRDMWALPDPAAINAASPAIDVVYRRVRDELRRRIEVMVQRWG